MRLATPFTAPARNNVSEQVQKSAVAQQQQHVNGNYRDTSNRRGLDSATVINDEDDDENDAAAIDTIQKQRRVKPKRGSFPSKSRAK